MVNIFVNSTVLAEAYLVMICVIPIVREQNYVMDCIINYSWMDYHISIFRFFRCNYHAFVNIISDEKLDLVFLLDGSTSITNAGFQDAKLFIKKLYSNFPIGEYSTHVGLVVFGEESKTIFDLIEYTDKQTLDMKLPSLLKYDSSENFLGRGLETVKKNVYDVSARPGGHQVLVIIAAGSSQDDVKAPSRDLRDEGVRIFCLGIGNNVDVNQLQNVVTAPEREHLATVTSDELDTLLGPVVQNIRKGKNKFDF